MTADEDVLWHQVGGLLSERRSWNIEMSSSPGAPEVWAFAPGGDTELSVGVDRDLIRWASSSPSTRSSPSRTSVPWPRGSTPRSRLVLARSSMTADVFTRRIWDRIERVASSGPMTGPGRTAAAAGTGEPGRSANR